MTNITWAGLGLLGSGTASSYVFFSNLGMSQYGLIPFIQGKVANVQLSGSDKVKTWQGFYDKGKAYSIAGAVVNVVCAGIVAFTHPAVEIRRLGLGSAVLSLTMVPYTLAFIMPTNKQLMALNDQAEKGEAVESAKADELVDTWVSLHRVRYFSYASAWLLSFAALALNGNVLIEVLDVIYRVPRVTYVVT